MQDNYLPSLAEALHIVAYEQEPRDFMNFMMAIVAIKKFPLESLSAEQQEHVPALKHLQDLLLGKRVEQIDLETREIIREEAAVLSPVFPLR